MKFLALAVFAVAVAGCSNAPVASKAVTHAGPDVDVEVLAMQSRPLRVYNPVPALKEAPEEEKPKPRRKRRRPANKTKAEKKVELPPDEVFVPKRSYQEPEPPIDIPADNDDWAADLSKEFQRRERERKRRGDEEGE